MKQTRLVFFVWALCWVLSRPINYAVAQKQSGSEPPFKSSKSPALLIAPFDKATAVKKQQEWTRHWGEKSHIQKNSIGMELVLIPPGEYMRGSSVKEIGKTVSENKTVKLVFIVSEQPRHRVRITKPFWIGKTEVTVGDFRRFVLEENFRTDAERDGKGGTGWNERKGRFEDGKPGFNWKNPGFFQSDNHPVVNVSWNDAMAYCRWLSKKEGKTYRLPTEAEWEYACRAGTMTRWHDTDEEEGLAKVGNVADESAKEKWGKNYRHVQYSPGRDGYAFSAPVGSFKSNSFGLFDMHGNVWEMCSDWKNAEEYQRYESMTAVDPEGPSRKLELRTLRGGSWGFETWNSRSAARFGGTPSSRFDNAGFRVVRNSD